MLFTEDQIENIMENVTMNEKHYNYIPYSPGTYYDPPEPAEVEIELELTVEVQLTHKQIRSLHKLKEDYYFKQYCELYLQKVLEKNLYDSESDYWETNVEEDRIDLSYSKGVLKIEITFEDYA